MVQQEWRISKYLPSGRSYGLGCLPQLGDILAARKRLDLGRGYQADGCRVDCRGEYLQTLLVHVLSYNPIQFCEFTLNPPSQTSGCCLSGQYKLADGEGN